MKKDATASIQYLKTIHIEKLSVMPKSWAASAGMAKGKKSALEKHARKVRNEWSSK